MGPACNERVIPNALAYITSHPILDPALSPAMI